MANIERTIGVNIHALMYNKNISLDDFAKQLDYSVKDIQNIIEGKIIISPLEIERISKIYKTTKRHLLSNKLNSTDPNSQYIKEFNNPDNLNRILDLMDEYVTLREVI